MINISQIDKKAARAPVNLPAAAESPMDRYAAGKIILFCGPLREMAGLAGQEN